MSDRNFTTGSISSLDMVSKDILFNHLHHRFGISGTALTWINDYQTVLKKSKSVMQSLYQLC